MATLENKSIIIFGGTAGMGYAVAEGVLKSGASEVFIVSSNQERVQEAVKTLQGKKLGHGVVKGEAINAKDTEALKQFVLRLGDVDHIVWTSGDSFSVDFPNVSLDVAKAAFDVRFWGPVIVAQNAKFRPGGSLVLTAGVALFKPLPKWSIGTSMLGAVQGLARGLAVDLAPIRVNLVAPGFVETDIWKIFSDDEKEAVRKQVTGNTLVKRVGLADEIAEAFLFAMKCSYLTGQSLIVDGGYLLA